MKTVHVLDIFEAIWQAFGNATPKEKQKMIRQVTAFGDAFTQTIEKASPTHARTGEAKQPFPNCQE